MKTRKFGLLSLLAVFILSLIPLPVMAISPDAADLNYEASVRQGKKTYTGADDKQHPVTKQDVQNVANRDAWRKRSLKHIGIGTSNQAPTVVDPTKAQRDEAKKRIQDAKKQYKKDVLANLKKEQKKINTARTKAKKDLAELQKKQKSLDKQISKEADRQIRYAAIYKNLSKSSDRLKANNHDLKSLQADSTEVPKILADYRKEYRESTGVDIVFTRSAAISMAQYKADASNSEVLKLNTKITKLNNDPKYKDVQTAVESGTYISKRDNSLEDKYVSVTEQIEKLKLQSKPLTKEQRKILADDIKKHTPKPTVPASTDGQGKRPGGGTPAASSTKSPDGKVAPASFANGKSYERHSGEGDIVVVTYLDIPGNKDRSDQRIGGIKVKLDKISGDASCDNRPKTADLTASTNTKKNVIRKDSKEKIFVHGTLNFRGCSLGKYKLTYVGRDGYKLRAGEDTVQTVEVKKDHTTEAVFTVVKK